MASPTGADGVSPAGRDEKEGVARCSSRGCTADAVWALVWNNPGLHTADRRKTWVACDTHREHLSAFLTARGFLRDVVPMADAPADPGPAPGPLTPPTPPTPR